MTTHNFIYKKAALHYAIYKGGPKVLIAFHGFSQTHSHFSSLAQVVSHEYTVYSIDLFYHGKSIWPDKEKPLTKKDWKEIMEAFLQEQNIKEFALAGFSLGGKFVLATFEAFPERVKSILFIAPDGIRTSFWYSLATKPALTRNYFKKLVDQPESFFKLLQILQKLQVVDQGVLRFAHYQMSIPQQREKIYNTWVSSRLLKFDMLKIARLINQHKVKVQMFLGRHDKLMTQKGMRRLLKHLHEYDLEILETGHYMLIDSVARHLRLKKTRPL